jgi:ribosome recycling factor
MKVIYKNLKIGLSYNSFLNVIGVNDARFKIAAFNEIQDINTISTDGTYYIMNKIYGVRCICRVERTYNRLSVRYYLENGDVITTLNNLTKSIDVFSQNLSEVRAGRANPAILNRVRVEYYGTPTPINQVAGISVPEARMIVIQPWDASILKEIEKAILASDIGLNPNNDGKLIRLNFPELTEERRKELVKDIKKIAEDAKVSIRAIRRDAIDESKSLNKEGLITEDELAKDEANIQKLTDKYVAEIDSILANKEKEIMSV